MIYLFKDSHQYNKLVGCTLFLILFFLTNETHSQEKYKYSDQNFNYILVLDSSHSTDKVNSCLVKEISIQRLEGKKTMQTIYLKENSPVCDFSEEELFIVEDVNFDGFNDIRLLQFVPAGPNLSYYYWTYNPQTKKFQKQTSLEEITSPRFDKDKKLIYSYWRRSGYWNGNSTYKYISGRLTLIEVEEEIEKDGKISTTIKRRMNGKLKLISKTIEKAE